jgi:hypothetical protein
MPVSRVLPHGRRSPENELFDRACDLVDTARALRSAAGAPDAGRAAPAVLGCLEAALHELALTATELEQISAIDGDTMVWGGAEPDTRVGRMHGGYANLRQALVDAETASSAARALTARVLGAAPAV